MRKIIIVLALSLCAPAAFANTSIYNCSRDYENAKAMVLADGTVENESSFLFATAIAVDACSELAEQRNFRGLKNSIASMRLKCDASARQGMSELYHGTCYLKLADLSRFILGQ